ncbi:MAG: M28 family peptidase [Armatimonadota bacterium]|nr:M28 family peptidase [Armatimonadota bacterium]
MTIQQVAALIAQVDEERLRHDLFYLAKDPLPYRKLNYTLPGHKQCTLYEADDYLAARLHSFGYVVEREGVAVQAFRCDPSKPKAQQYAPPLPEDPWYTAWNLYARKRGSRAPDETVVILAHKDSQSWVDSPGAYDNAVGTVSVLEIARILAPIECRRSLCFLFCNEEHRPWTSVTAAEGARTRGENLVAIFNLDGLGGKSREEQQLGKKTNVTLYTTDEGERLADLMAEVNQRYTIGLEQRKHRRANPGDDDGSFIKAGFAAAVANIGSYPYGDPNYHRETDVPELVDLANVRMATQASLAAVLTVAEEE